MKLLSLVGLGLIMAALLALWRIGAIFSPLPWLIALQILAGLLMIWARFTFGARSFHAAANPTAGGLVTNGPYRFIRHPIYAAITLFTWAGVVAHLSLLTVSLGLLATVGVIVRLLCEEHLVVRSYPEYRAYSERTRRLLPGVW
jgi:protein-S-isoprenylcysteine O-methyltransferase Ste14